MGGQYAGTAVTDAKGNYKIDGLPKVARYHIQTTPAESAPFLPDLITVEDRPGLEPVKCDIKVISGVFVTGRVTDKEGKGVESRVSCLPLPENKIAQKLSAPRNSFRSVLTDSEGRFRLRTVPGPNFLAATVVGPRRKVGVRQTNPYKSAELTEADRKRVTITNQKARGQRIVTVLGGRPSLEISNSCRVVDISEDTATSFDLTVDPGKKVTLRLKDPEGKPLPGATVVGVDALRSTALSLESDECPVFALDPKKPRQLVFLHPKRKLAGVVTVRGDEKAPIIVTLTATATVTGRLLDQKGEPLADATVNVQYEDTAMKAIPRGRQDRSLSRSSEKGRFQIDGLFPGAKFTLFVRQERTLFLEDNTPQRKPLKAGATTDLGDIRVKPRTK